jgi:DNA-binding response OmpR family regulator
VASVLVVDDEPIVREMVARYLQRDGFEALETADGFTALQLLETRRPDLVVLDVMLPGLDGLEVCRRLHAMSELPVILLTGRSEESDRIVGLELGADDYITKPFSPRELVARVKAVLRRSGRFLESAASGRIAVGGLEIDPACREVRRAGRTLRLTAREFDLLLFLATHPRQVFSRDQLMDRVWGYDAVLDTGTVTVHIRRLRAKIERDPARPVSLQTVWGVGYRWMP